MIKRSDFTSRLRISLIMMSEDTKRYLKKTYEKCYNFIIISSFIICLFAAAYFISLNYIIPSIFLTIFLTMILFVGFGFEEE